MTHSSSGPDQPDYSGPPVPYEISPPEVYLPHPDANPYPYQPAPSTGGRAKKIIAGAAVVAVLAGGAVAAYAYSVLASSGIQPERVLPANTVAFAKLDLDPAAGQKIAVYRLSKKFPALSKGAANIQDEKNAALSALFGDQSELNYTADIKPWLGDRVAIAAVPDASSESGLDPVIAVAYTDEAKMKAAFGKAARAEKDFGYVTVNGYALVTDSQAHAENVLTGVRHATLASNGHYRADLRSLRGDQIAVGWADLSATVAALKVSDQSALGASGLGQLKGLSAAGGRVIIGAHASSDYLEVTAVAHQDRAAKASRAADKPVEGTLTRLDSATTSAALEVSGLGDAFSAAWTNAATNPALRQQAEGFLASTGLRLPTDLVALFGTDTTVSVHLPHGTSGEPDVAVQVSTSGAGRAKQLIDELSQQPPLDFFTGNLHASLTSGGYLVSTNPGYQPQARPGSLALGDDPAFVKAVPNSAKAGLIGYVNIGSLLDSDPQASAKDRADWKHVGSLGLSSIPGPDGDRILLRLTTR
jgi:Protein of unknown function (DUF3352)